MGVIYPRGELKVITLPLVKGIQLELRASWDILRIIYLDTPLEAEKNHLLPENAPMLSSVRRNPERRK